MVRIRRSGGGHGVLMLAATVLQIGVDRIPPVTLLLVMGQSAIFLDFLPRYFPSPTAVCMSSYLVLQHRDWRRMILGTFMHGSDMHLYFNMVSLIYKGIKLERKFGSLYFTYLVAVFTALTSSVYVAIGQGLGHALNDQSYVTSCAVGFSGVLFALKVLATEYSEPGTQYAFGVIPVPSRYIFWAELVLIQLVTPNASFVGHLAGILVGLLYTRGPLKILMDAFIPPDDRTPGSTPNPSIMNMFSSPQRQRSSSAQQQPRFVGGGQTTGSRSPPSAPLYTDSNRSNDDYYRSYTGGLTEEEQLRRAMEQSQQGQDHSSQQTQDGRLYPDLSDLRNRRAQFYQ